MRFPVFAGAAMAALALLAAASGCGRAETVIDMSKIQSQVEANLRGARHEKVRAVRCPSRIEVQRGATFSCTVRLADGRTQTESLRIVDDEGNVEQTGLRTNK